METVSFLRPIAGDDEGHKAGKNHRALIVVLAHLMAAGNLIQIGNG